MNRPRCPSQWLSAGLFLAPHLAGCSAGLVTKDTASSSPVRSETAGHPSGADAAIDPEYAEPEREPQVIGRYDFGATVDETASTCEGEKGEWRPLPSGAYLCLLSPQPLALSYTYEFAFCSGALCLVHQWVDPAFLQGKDDAFPRLLDDLSGRLGSPQERSVDAPAECKDLAQCEADGLTRVLVTWKWESGAIVHARQSSRLEGGKIEISAAAPSGSRLVNDCARGGRCSLR